MNSPKTPSGITQEELEEHAGNLTLRDHFATIALRAIIPLRPRDTAESKALEAYQIADSMMRQRVRSASGLG